MPRNASRPLGPAVQRNVSVRACACICVCMSFACAWVRVMCAHIHARTHAFRSTNSEWRTAEEALLSIVRVWPITYLEPLCRLRACARDGALFTLQSSSHTVRCVGRTEPPRTARTCTRCEAYNARCSSGRSTLYKACGARSALYGRRRSNRSTYQCFVMLRDACFACIIAQCG